MTYWEWFETHAAKHAAIVQGLSHLSDAEVIDYFAYNNLRQTHPDFCPLFATNTKCHNMDDLNCYLCGCPHFRYWDEGVEIDEKKTKSRCTINARQAKVTSDNEGFEHCDCSECILPHTKGFIKKYFSRDWREIIQECSAKQ